MPRVVNLYAAASRRLAELEAKHHQIVAEMERLRAVLQVLRQPPQKGRFQSGSTS